jgi:hypothetical protein
MAQKLLFMVRQIELSAKFARLGGFTSKLWAATDTRLWRPFLIQKLCDG